jgi:hypothetical protein
VDVGRIAESDPLTIEAVAKLVAERREKRAARRDPLLTAVRIQMRIISFWGWYAPNSSVLQPSSRTRRGEAPTPCAPQVLLRDSILSSRAAFAAAHRHSWATGSWSFTPVGVRRYSVFGGTTG